MNQNALLALEYFAEMSCKNVFWRVVKTKTHCVLPSLWVISQDVEEGVDSRFKLPGSEYVREVGDVAFPSVEHKRDKRK